MSAFEISLLFFSALIFAGFAWCELQALRNFQKGKKLFLTWTWMLEPAESFTPKGNRYKTLSIVLSGPYMIALAVLMLHYVA